MRQPGFLGRLVKVLSTDGQGNVKALPLLTNTTMMMQTLAESHSTNQYSLLTESLLSSGANGVLQPVYKRPLAVLGERYWLHEFSACYIVIACEQMTVDEPWGFDHMTSVGAVSRNSQRGTNG